jgi:hypothetical protein
MAVNAGDYSPAENKCDVEISMENPITGESTGIPHGVHIGFCDRWQEGTGHGFSKTS